MSAGVPLKPGRALVIMSFAFGSANRLPGAPPAMISAAADIPMPTHVVATSGFTYCIAS